MDKLVYHLWLTLLLGVKSIELDLLLNAFGSAEEVYRKKRGELLSLGGLKSDTVERIIKNRDLDDAMDELYRCKKLGVKIIPSYSEKFPVRLLNIYCPPHILYVKGNLGNIDEELCISVVGTRSCSRYGLDSARFFGQGLAGLGVTVVSGGARGIDTAALKGAHRAYGRTIAVMGCGVDVVYPRENRDFFRAIATDGAVISEFPLGTPPAGANFPIRNRIISGLSQGVLVVEAPKKSGALITARNALEQGRDIFVVPGEIASEYCEGSNELIKEGAYLVTDARDIVGQYRYFIPVMRDNLNRRLRGEEFADDEETAPVPKKEVSVSKEEAKKAVLKEEEPKKSVDTDKYEGAEKEVLTLLIEGDMTADEMLAHVSVSSSELNTALITLEMEGIILKKLDKRYSII
ncbi:MAG: DNA-processing protein DprA [Clostridia bacterium]|nr:DNA-processing protein DprA [Clostridia bacterium]